MGNPRCEILDLFVVLIRDVYRTVTNHKTSNYVEVFIS